VEREVQHLAAPEMWKDARSKFVARDAHCFAARRTFVAPGVRSVAATCACFAATCACFAATLR